MTKCTQTGRTAARGRTRSTLRFSRCVHLSVALLMLASPLVEVQDDQLMCPPFDAESGGESVGSTSQTSTEQNWMDEISLYPPARLRTVSTLRLMTAWTPGLLDVRFSPDRGSLYQGIDFCCEPGLNQLDASSYRAPLLL